MLKLKLNKSLFSLMENNISEAISKLENVTEDDKIISFEITKDNLVELQLDLNDEIVLHGMDNQDTVNDLGLKLYKLYDEILYQKNNQ